MLSHLERASAQAIDINMNILTDIRRLSLSKTKYERPSSFYDNGYPWQLLFLHIFTSGTVLIRIRDKTIQPVIHTVS